MIRRLPRWLPRIVSLCTLFATLASVARAQSTLTYDFETPGQWNANFRTLAAVGGTATGQTTVSSNGVFRQDSTGGSTAGGYLLDQTPADTTAGTQSTFATDGTLTVRFDARTSVNNASFAVIFADPANLDNNVLAIVNLNTGADQVRFFRDSQPGTAHVPIGTQVNTTVGTQTTPNTGAEPGSAFTTVTVRLTVSGTTPTLVVSWGGSTTTSVFAAGDFNFPSGRSLVAFRLNDVNVSATTLTPIDLDNIVVTETPPEPNVAPVLPAQSNRGATPYQTLSVNNAATDANSSQSLSYQLLSPPAGASINPSGVITWEPTADQADTTFTLTTRVTDNGSPALSAENSFDVTVGAFTVYNRTLGFTASGEFTGNFRALTRLSGANSTVSQTTADGTGLVRFDADIRNSSPEVPYAVYLYDTSPADTTLATQTTFDTATPLTVSADVRAVTAGSEVAIVFADPENPSNNVSALFTIRTGTDLIRLYKDGVRNTAGTTFGIGTQVGVTTTVATAAEPGASAAFTNFSVTLSREGTQPTLTVTVAGAGASPVTYLYYLGNINWARTTVLLRVDDAGETALSTPVDVDNITLFSASPPVSPIAANTAPLLIPAADRSVPAGRLRTHPGPRRRHHRLLGHHPLASLRRRRIRHALHLRRPRHRQRHARPVHDPDLCRHRHRAGELWRLCPRPRLLRRRPVRRLIPLRLRRGRRRARPNRLPPRPRRQLQRRQPVPGLPL
jgi:hypothetical protein